MASRFSSSAELFAWLDTFINLERNLSAASFRLDRMETLARIAGNPERAISAIHVAGSKGKGSVSTMIASILGEAGLTTGLYVSPHITDYRERVGLSSGPFSEDIYAGAGDSLREAVQKAGELPGGSPPTFFELMTLLFFLCARRAGCRAVVLETGIGGRLDATNIVDPVLSVITPIELEHTDILGRTIAAIAFEKAGIIKPGRPVLVSSQRPEAMAVFEAASRERGSFLYPIDRLASTGNVSIDRDGTTATAQFTDDSIFSGPLPFSLSLVGEVQAENALLAMVAVRIAFPRIDDQSILRGLKGARLPARFELACTEPPVILDGAHTERSIELTVGSFTELYGAHGLLLFACAKDKDVQAMARRIAGRFDSAIVTSPGGWKQGTPELSLEVFAAAGIKTELIGETATAVKTAVERASAGGKPLLIAGSFYLAAEAARFIRSRG